MTSEEKHDIGKQIQTALEDLHKIPTPGYFGALDRQPFPDGIFWTREGNPETSGPFDTEEESNKGIIRRLEASESAPYISLLQAIISDTLKGHRAIFTHGDLQPKNILVSRSGTKEDGRGGNHAYLQDGVPDASGHSERAFLLEYCCWCTWSGGE